MENYKENGYLLLEKIVPVQLLNEIKSDIQNLFKEDIFQISKRDQKKFIAIANISQYLISVNKLTTNPCIVQSLKMIGITNPVINTRPLISYSHKDLALNDMYWKVPAHQDWASMQGSIDSVTIWIPLCDLQDDMGYLEVIPKSHLQGFLPLKDDTVLKDDSFDEKEFIPIRMNLGDILIFNTFLIHRSGINKSDNIRLTTHLRYDNADEDSFVQRNFPHHRVDKRANGIVNPELDTKALVNKLFVMSK